MTILFFAAKFLICLTSGYCLSRAKRLPCDNVESLIKAISMAVRRRAGLLAWLRHTAACLRPVRRKTRLILERLFA